MSRGRKAWRRRRKSRKSKKIIGEILFVGKMKNRKNQNSSVVEEFWLP